MSQCLSEALFNCSANALYDVNIQEVPARVKIVSENVNRSILSPAGGRFDKRLITWSRTAAAPDQYIKKSFPPGLLAVMTVPEHPVGVMEIPRGMCDP